MIDPLLRLGLSDQLDAVYQRLGEHSAELWPHGPVSVWAVWPGADLVQLRWPRTGLEIEAPAAGELEPLVLDGSREYLRSASGQWLAMRGHGNLLAAVRLGLAKSADDPIPSDELRELIRLGELVLTHMADRRLDELWSQLAPRLANCKRLNDYLDQLLKEVLDQAECTQGYAALRTTSDPDWAKVAACVDPQREVVLDQIPIAFDSIRTALQAGRPVDFWKSKHDSDIGLAIRKLKERYGREHALKFSKLEREVKARLLVPLWNDREVIGLLSCHRLNDSEFRAEQVGDLTRLVRKARAALARRETEERPPVPSLDEAREIIRKILNYDQPADARTKICELLAKTAHQLARAFRVAIAVRLADERALTVPYLYPRDNWPLEFLNSKLPFDSPSACVRAFLDGKPYLLPDLREVHVEYLTVSSDGDTMKSAAAIPIGLGPTRFGTLFLDWRSVAAFDEALINQLATLAEIYAHVLVPLNFDDSFAKLDELIQASGETPDMQHVLRLIARDTGADAGSLFLTRPGEPERLFREACLRRVDDPNPQPAVYRFDQGLTGWIARNKRVLLLPSPDLANELARIDPNLQIAGISQDYTEESANRNAALLGLPILADGQVLGVVRLRRIDGREFSAMDRYQGEALVNRLASALSKRRKEQLERQLSKLRHELNSLDLPLNILDAVKQHAETVLGPLKMLLRGLERHGTEQLLVPLFASSEEVRRSAPPVLHCGESVSGWVWREQNDRYVRDMRDPAEVADLTLVVEDEPWRSVLALRLQRGADSDFLGTLVFMDERPGVFAEMDVAFLKEAANETAAALDRAQRYEQQRLAHKLYRLAANFPNAVAQQGADRAQLERQLYFDLTKVVAESFGTRYHGVGLPSEEPTFFVLHKANGDKVDQILDGNGRPRFGVPSLSLRILEPKLHQQSHLLLDMNQTREFYGDLVGGQVTLSDLDEVVQEFHHDRLLIVPLWAEERLRAFFLFIIPALHLLSQDLVEEVAVVLKDIDKILCLADQRDAERQISDTRLLLSLLGGAASHLQHKMKQPVYRLRGNLEALCEEDSPETMQELARQMINDVDLFDQTTSEFVKFAQRFKDDPTPTDLCVVLREAIEEQALAQNRCRLDVHGNSHAFVDGYHEPLVTAFHHLWQNANEFIGSRAGGIVRIDLDKAGESYIVRIHDNGGGMDDETRSRIFEPFFSSRGSSGLGLPVARAIIDAHHGQITLDSVLGQGTVVTVSFPRSKS